MKVTNSPDKLHSSRSFGRLSEVRLEGGWPYHGQLIVNNHTASFSLFAKIRLPDEQLMREGSAMVLVDKTGKYFGGVTMSDPLRIFSVVSQGSCNAVVFAFRLARPNLLQSSTPTQPSQVIPLQRDKAAPAPHS